MVTKTEIFDYTRSALLECSVQNYDWGIIGNDSLVAKIHKKNSFDKEIDELKPYAEVQNAYCAIDVFIIYLVVDGNSS